MMCHKNKLIMGLGLLSIDFAKQKIEEPIKNKCFNKWIDLSMPVSIKIIAA